MRFADATRYSRIADSHYFERRAMPLLSLSAARYYFADTLSLRYAYASARRRSRLPLRCRYAAICHAMRRHATVDVTPLSPSMPRAMIAERYAYFSLPAAAALMIFACALRHADADAAFRLIFFHFRRHAPFSPIRRAIDGHYAVMPLFADDVFASGAATRCFQRGVPSVLMLPFYARCHCLPDAIEVRFCYDFDARGRRASRQRDR